MINAIKTEKKIQMEEWRELFSKDRKQNNLVSQDYFLACELRDFLFDPAFVQSISILEC